MSPSLTSSAALELQALHNTGQTFPVVVQLMNATRWGHAAALALISYDTLLTFRDEVQYIWPMKLSIIKVLIYGNRLSALSVILIHAGPMVGLNRSFTTKDCQGIFIASGCCSLVAFSIANWIMLGRTKALLGGNRMYNILLNFFFFAVQVVSFVLLTISLVPVISNTFYSSWLHVCAIVFRSNIMVIEWICPTVFSAAILLLTIGKLYQKASAGVALYDSELVVVLYRDGLCHYVLILCLLTWTVICWTVLPMTYMLTGFYILWAVLAVAITRLQVNLIKASVPQRINEQEDGGDYSHRMNTIRPFRRDHQQYAQPTSAPTFDVIVISREFV